MQGDRLLKRDSNNELLRLLSGLAVIVLHYNSIGGGKGAFFYASGVHLLILEVLETVCIIAVNIFILIFGFYHGKSEKISIWRPIRLIAEVVIFNVLLYALDVFVFHTDVLSVRRLFSAALPVNYFVILYCALYIISPFINTGIHSLDRRAFRRLIITAFLLFSIYATGVELLKEVTGNPLQGLSSVGLSGADAGYTFIQFMLMYLIRAYFGSVGVSEKLSSPLLAAAWLLSAVMVFITKKFFPATAYAYCSPFVISEAVFLFLLFQKISFRSRIVNSLAPAAFVCFLIHAWILQKADFTIISGDAGLAVKLLHLLVMIVLIFLISVAVHYLYEFSAGYLFKFLEKKSRRRGK